MLIRTQPCNFARKSNIFAQSHIRFANLKLNQMTTKIIKIIAIALALCFLCSACKNDDEPAPIPTPECRRTILLYVVAANSLGNSGYDKTDIEDVLKFAKNNSLNDCRIIGYHSNYDLAAPELFEITKDGSNSAKKTIKTYSNEPGASVTIDRMKEVFSDMTQLYKSKEYELILWSHATAWAASMQNAPNKTFGQDRGFEMPILELAQAIPDNLFHTINFDACYMASVEVAYELRNKAQFMIASPTEVLGKGMPYELVMSDYVATELKPENIAKTVFDYYNTQSSQRYCTISVVKLSAIPDLAQICKQIKAAALPDPALSSMQYYNRQLSPFLIDFAQYYTTISPSDEATRQFNDALANAVVYKAATPRFSTLIIDPDNFSGLSTYMLNTYTPQHDATYRTLSWHLLING